MKIFKSACATLAGFGLCWGLSLWAQTPPAATDGPFPEKKVDPDVRSQAIETRRLATREYLEERLKSAAQALQDLTQPSEKAIPPGMLKLARGLYLFDQWQAGHLITTEVCAGVGAARAGAVWGRVVFYRAFDLGNGEGLQSGTRQARRIVLLVLSDKALQWMPLSRWKFDEAKAQGAKILVGPRGTLPKDFDPLAADVWVYDDSAADLPAGSAYPGGGTILDNPWATQTAYEATELPDIGAYLRENGAHAPELLQPFWQALQRAAP